MVPRTSVSAGDIGPDFVIPNLTIKEMQADTVSSVLPPLLRVEVIKRAPIVLINVSVLHQHALGSGGDLGLETFGNALGLELRIQHFG